MIEKRVPTREGEHGFTLIEALVALALTGLILSALATLTAQWLPSWNRGVDRVQRTEMVTTALQRITADLAAAEFIPASRESKNPLFDGTALSVTFARTAIGPNADIGLDVVRINEGSVAGRLVTVRSRASLTPWMSSQQTHFSSPVVLLQPPFRLSFSYAGADHVFRDDWRDMDSLPAKIRLTLRDAATERILSVSTIAPVHINAPAHAEKAGQATQDTNRDEEQDDKPSEPPRQGGT